jgi:hypothetical protein
MNEYESYIARCKAPKKLAEIKKIVKTLIAGASQGFDNVTLAMKMNTALILTVMNKAWTPNNTAMAVLKASRFDKDSSLAYGLACMLRSGEVSQEELMLLRNRTRLA